MIAKNILVWLPSPMGDAILCTPALRAIRQHLSDGEITFFGRTVVREILSPCSFNNLWLEQRSKNPFVTANMLKKHKFDCAMLFKNSFASAMTVFFAGIPRRLGYAREGRGFLLTDKLFPPRLPDGRFKPFSMVDYYLEIAKHLGANTNDRTLELSIDAKDSQALRARLPQIVNSGKPIIIFVPGGAFGQSKCWPADRFAQTAERLISDYDAEIIISVSANQEERQIAEEICSLSKYKLTSLAETPVSLGELKALFSAADLVISNDTGPRHIAIALRRKVISLFGPNDPVWTDSGYENEIQIVGDVPCAPCARPKCKEEKHLCMEAITVEMVCEAAAKLFEKSKK